MSQKRASRVTIADVAAAAGVSTATAGRALGDYGYVATDMRERVRDVAKSLGYRPNGLARSLITGRTQTVGVVIGDLQSPFYAAMLRAVTDRLRQLGYGTIVTGTDEILEREVEAVHLLLSKQVDGLIVAPSDPARAEHLLAAARTLPIVQIDRVAAGVETDTVLVDNRAAAAQATAALIAAGHRRIAIVAELQAPDKGTADMAIKAVLAGNKAPPLPAGTSWQRLQGYADALRSGGIPPHEAIVSRVGRYSLEAARDWTLALIEQGRATALFTADGLMSSGAMAALSTAKVAIPNALSLICFDDLDWMSFLAPGIAAIAQPLAALGETAAELLVTRLSEPGAPPRHLQLEPTLKLRGSVAAPPS